MGKLQAASPGQRCVRLRYAHLFLAPLLLLRGPTSAPSAGRRGRARTRPSKGATELLELDDDEAALEEVDASPVVRQEPDPSTVVRQKEPDRRPLLPSAAAGARVQGRSASGGSVACTGSEEEEEADEATRLGALLAPRRTLDVRIVRGAESSFGFALADLSYAATSDYNRVSKLQRGGPAEAAGLALLDKVVAANGVPVPEGQSLMQMGMLAGAAEVRLTVGRPGPTDELHAAAIARLLGEC